MTLLKTSRRVAIAGAAAFAMMSGPALADGHQKLESIHFLIPGGAGGGWDGTARGTGEALTAAGLVARPLTKTCPAAVAARPSAI